MRQGLFGAALGLGIALVGWSLVNAGPQSAGRGDSPGRSGELLAFCHRADDQTQLLYIVDPARNWFGIYRIDLNNGKVSLEAARNFTWDSQLLEWDNVPPEVDSIRGMSRLP